MRAGKCQRPRCIHPTIEANDALQLVAPDPIKAAPEGALRGSQELRSEFERCWGLQISGGFCAQNRADAGVCGGDKIDAWIAYVASGNGANIGGGVAANTPQHAGGAFDGLWSSLQCAWVAKLEGRVAGKEERSMAGGFEQMGEIPNMLDMWAKCKD